MLRTLVLAASATLLMTGIAAADPIEGNWRTESGSTAQIAPCGGEFCVTLVSGEHSGKQIGQMRATGDGRYKGSITDPADDKTYSGSGSLSGDVLKMKGCVLAILCQTQTWNRL